MFNVIEERGLSVPFEQQSIRLDAHSRMVGSEYLEVTTGRGRIRPFDQNHLAVRKSPMDPGISFSVQKGLYPIA